MIGHLGLPTLEPLQLAPLAVVAGAYAVRARTLRRRGQGVRRARGAAFAGFVVVTLAAVASPLHELGEERLFSAHMLQHVLLADAAALLLLLSLTGPMLRPILAVRAVDRLRALAHPLVALPLWAASLVTWHLPALYELALRSAPVHLVEHAFFFGTGMLMWASVVEVLPGPAWFGTGAKLAYVVAVRLVETVVGNVFFWAGEPVYRTYAEAPRTWGLSAAADQATAGGIMMIEGSLVTIAALAWLFLRLGAEGELRQRLLEQGVDPRAARRAVRYGRGEELLRG